jgi:hypothetical protein
MKPCTDNATYVAAFNSGLGDSMNVTTASASRPFVGISQDCPRRSVFARIYEFAMDRRGQVN